jgi:acetoacetyl-CoA synthetase
MADSTSNGTNGSVAEAVIGRHLWEHPSPETTQLYSFKEHVAQKYGLTFGPETSKDRSLWRWSVDHVPEFWAEVWERCGIRSSSGFETVRRLSFPEVGDGPWLRLDFLCRLSMRMRRCFPDLRGSGARN